jgi:DNA-binding response OmpR family regulator
MAVLSQISRALVVEDNFVLAVELQSELFDLGCPESLIACRVENAILALNVGVQFAILDVELAGEPCTELAERLVASGIHFIYCSGYVREDFPELPNAPWINKPASAGELAAAISAAVEQGPHLSMTSSH